MKKHCIALSIFAATFVYSQSFNRPQTPKPPFPYLTEDVSFKNNSQGNVLAGTIMTPKNFSEDSPIMVMITGSGMQNRDEEGFGHKTFLVIADNLARKGIVTLRLDDRGIGGSEKGKDGPTSQDFAGDISSAVNFLAGKGFKNIGLIGHSEGGMIAPMVANMNKNVKFLVLLAGPDLHGNEILMYQSHAEGRLQSATEEQLRQNDLAQAKIFNFIKNYQGNNLQNDLKAFMIPEMRKLAGEKALQEQIEKMAEQQAKMASMPWFVYFLKYNPDENLSKYKSPCWLWTVAWMSRFPLKKISRQYKNL